MHQDWVNDLKFFPEIDSTISCCSDPNTSLVIAKTFGRTDVKEALKDLHVPSLKRASIGSLSRKNLSYPFPSKKHLPGDELVFKIRKGVKSFDYNKRLNILATGIYLYCLHCYVYILSKFSHLFVCTPSFFSVFLDKISYLCWT